MGVPGMSQLESELERLFSPRDARRGNAPVFRMLDAVPFGVAILAAPQLVFMYANRVYESWYEPDRRPLLGKRLEDALESAPDVAEIFHEAVRSGEPWHFPASRFFGLRNRPAVLPGGVTVWDWSLLPIKDASGEVRHLVVTGVDVTGPALDRLHLEASHQRALEVLHQVSRSGNA